MGLCLVGHHPIHFQGRLCQPPSPHPAVALPLLFAAHLLVMIPRLLVRRLAGVEAALPCPDSPRTPALPRGASAHPARLLYDGAARPPPYRADGALVQRGRRV